MNENQITIVVDAMGSDNSPEKTIKGCEIFLNNNSNSKENKKFQRTQERNLEYLTIDWLTDAYIHAHIHEYIHV